MAAVTAGVGIGGIGGDSRDGDCAADYGEGKHQGEDELVHPNAPGSVAVTTGVGIGGIGSDGGDGDCAAEHGKGERQSFPGTAG
jgi:hypothetical protein